MIVVTPPQAAATVAEWKSSAVCMPIKLRSAWVCASTPPGNRYFPAQSISRPAGPRIQRLAGGG